MRYLYQFIFSAIFTFLLIGQADILAQSQDQIDRLQQFAQEQQAQWEIQHAEAVKKAEEAGIPVRQTFPDGTVIELQKFENGFPVYNRTYNLNAAEASSTDELWPGGALGLDLTGSSQTLGVWDGGKVRDTHQEFGGRVTQQDGATDLSDHATHVAGTMIAAGVDPDAKGMSYQGDLDAYDWSNDNSEMATAAANGLLVSNHSYGTRTGWEWNSDESVWYWYGDTNISETEDYRFGFYNSDAENWDDIVYNAPNYVIVKSAGNDRNDVPDSQPVEHQVWDSSEGKYVSSTTVRDPDGDYYSLANKATAKNIITMGAVWSSGSMAGFSSWGPTNDARIKPDIVATGVNLNSASSSGDSDYTTKGGTSMSSPTVSGSIGLLQEHYINLYEEDPLASTIKALVIHTADDLGLDGPDYSYGWGMLNTASAAEVLSNDVSNEYLTHVQERTLISGAEHEEVVWNDGEEPLRATIVWTDPAGTPVSPSVDAIDKMLVNDLDLRLVNEEGEEFEPYKHDPAGVDAPFMKGDNDRDNVEQVYIDTPEKGYYTIKVTNKGDLENGSQDYSMIVTGNSDAIDNADPGYLTLSEETEEGYAYASSNIFTNVSGSYMTIELWVKMDASSDEDAVILTKKGSDDGSDGYRLRTIGGGEERPILFAPTDFGSRHVVSNTGIRANEWTHIAAVYNDGNSYIYINGTLDAESINGSRNIGSNLSHLTIGSNTGRNGQFFRGSIDDLRIWSSARSMFDIQGSFLNELEGDESSLSVYYPFNTESSLIASDATRNGSTLNFENIIGTEEPGVFPVTPLVNGKIADESVELKIKERGYTEGTASEYKIYRTTNGSRTAVATIDASNNSYTDNGLTNEQTYFYEVTTIDDEGNEGDFSNPLSLTPNQRIGGTSLAFEDQGFVSFTHRPNLNISGNEMTIEFWIKRDKNSEGVQAIATNKTQISSNGYGVYMINGGEEARIQFTPTDFGSRHVTSNTGIRAGEWTHVSAVYNDGNTQLYINGKLDVENINSSRSIGSTSNELTLGSNVENNGQFFQGEIDELRIWNKRRTLSEVESDFNKILWGDEDGLVGYWRFDATEQSNVYSQAMRPSTSSGTGAVSTNNDGVYPIPPKLHAQPFDGSVRLFVDQPEYAGEDVDSYNIYRYTDSQNRSLLTSVNSSENTHEDEVPANETTYFYEATIVDSDGGESDESYPITSTLYENRQAGQALRFETNQSAHVQFEYNPALDISGDSITVEAWINKDAASQGGSIILGNNEASSNGYGLYITDNSDSSRVTFSPTDFGSRHVTSETYLEPNKWYHVAGVYQDGDTFIYINGALDNTSNNSSRSIGSTHHGMVFGASHLGADSYFIGEIDEVRIWNKRIDQSLINQRYNQALQGNEEGLVGYWRFDEPNGDVIRNSANPPMDGELVNNPGFVLSAALEGTPFVPMLSQPSDLATEVEVPLAFEWHPIDNAVNYELEVSRTQSFKKVIMEREIQDTSTTMEMGLDHDSTYYWRVRAITNQFATNWSDVWTFTTELPVPETPEWEPADGSEDMETQLTLKWSEADRAETYNVQMSTEADFSNTHIDSSGIQVTELHVEDLETSTTYYWRVSATNKSGSSGWSEVLEFTTVATSAGELSSNIPEDFEMHQNYPNPFNPSTEIRYGIPEASEVQLVIYDMLGRRVTQLVNERQSAGYHQVNFDAGNLASGIYIYRLQAGEHVITKKMMLAK